MLVAVGAPDTLCGQAVAGAGDDAIPITKGVWRFRVGGLWNDYTAVFAPTASGGTQHRALLAPLNADNLGTQAFPQLAAAEQAMRSLGANSAFKLSLGTFEAVGDVRQASIPFVVDVGVTKRFSVGVSIPYIESRNRSRLVLNRIGTSANVGQNPAYSTTEAATARATNGSLLRQLAAARSQLSAEITRCASVTATGCDAIRANAAGAQSLLQRAQATQLAVVTVYGDSTRAGAPVVPISGSDVNTAILATIAQIRTSFQSFGISAITQGAAPAAATVIYGPGSLPAIVSDTAFGTRYNNIAGTRRAGIGDVDVTVTALLKDTFQGDSKRRLENTGRALRTVVAGGLRIGSAGADRVEDPLDVPIGEGASALLLRTTTDIIANNRYWVSLTARVVQPFADNVAVALPFLTDSTLFRSFVAGTARRSLGMRTEIEIAPRVMFGQFFGLSTAYLFRRVGTDRLTPTGTFPDALNPGLSVTTDAQVSPATSTHLLSVAASFSSLASYMRGSARYPVELQFVHTAAIASSGGVVPISSTDRLEIRLYRGFSRR